MYVHKILHIQPFLCKKKHMMRWDSCGNFLFSCGNEKATLRAGLRVALKFLKLTAFVNEILWWARRDSNPGPTD